MRKKAEKRAAVEKVTALYDEFARGIRALLNLPIPQELHRCKLCGDEVPVTDMAIKAVAARRTSGYWDVGTAAHCGRCSEIRAEGVTGEAGFMKRLGAPSFFERLQTGFKVLGDFPQFGELEWWND